MLTGERAGEWSIFYIFMNMPSSSDNSADVTSVYEDDHNVNNTKHEMRSVKWKEEEEIALATLKRDQFKRDLVDHQYNLTTSDYKWEEISDDLKKEGIDFTAARAKKKWDNIVSDFKKIMKYQSKSGAQDWWNMSDLADKKACGLKLNTIGFSQELFILVTSFMGDSPAVNAKFVIHNGEKRKIKVEDEKPPGFTTRKYKKRVVEETDLKEEIKQSMGQLDGRMEQVVSEMVAFRNVYEKQTTSLINAFKSEK